MRAPGAVDDSGGGGGAPVMLDRPPVMNALQEDLQRRHAASMAMWQRNHNAQAEHYKAIRPDEIAVETESKEVLRTRFLEDFKKRTEAKVKETAVAPVSAAPITPNHPHLNGGGMQYSGNNGDPMLYAANPNTAMPPVAQSHPRQDRKRKNTAPPIMNGYGAMYQPPATNGLLGNNHHQMMLNHNNLRPPLYMPNPGGGPTGYPMGMMPHGYPGQSYLPMQIATHDPEMTMGPDADVSRFEEFIPRRAELPDLRGSLDAYLDPDGGIHSHHPGPMGQQFHYDQMPSTSTAAIGPAVSTYQNCDLAYQTSPSGTSARLPLRSPNGTPGAVLTVGTNGRSPSTSSASSIASGPPPDHQQQSNSFAVPGTSPSYTNLGESTAIDPRMKLERISPQSVLSPQQAVGSNLSHLVTTLQNLHSVSRSQSCDQPAVTSSEISTTQRKSPAAKKRTSRVNSATTNSVISPRCDDFFGQLQILQTTSRSAAACAAARASTSAGLPQPSCVISTYPLSQRSAPACAQRMPMNPAMGHEAVYLQQLRQQQMFYQQQPGLHQQQQQMQSVLMQPPNQQMEDRMPNGASATLIQQQQQQQQQRAAALQHQHQQQLQMRHPVAYPSSTFAPAPTNAMAQQQYNNSPLRPNYPSPSSQSTAFPYQFTSIQPPSSAGSNGPGPYGTFQY